MMRLLLLALLPAAVLVSCDEDGDDNIVNPQEDEARVLVVHASPDAGGVDLSVDGTKVNTAALTYPNNTGYLTVAAGQRAISVNSAGTTDGLISGNLNFGVDKSYTLFATGTASDVQPLLIEDDLTAPASGSAKVRFVHLSPDAPMVDITGATGGGAQMLIFDDISYREFTGFMTVPAGLYDLRVLLSADDSEALAVPGVLLQSGKIYTIFARGYATPPAGNNNTLGAQVIVHN